jgi:hypothetical protein
MEIGRTTVANILAEAGIEPAPEREKKRTWMRFIKMHWESLYACDFFSVEVLGIFGTVRQMVFFVIEIKTRAVEIAGIEVDPDGEWMKQIARNLTDPVDGFLRGAKYFIHDRDPLFTEAFTAILRSRGVEGVKTPAKSPNGNPHAERFVKTIKYECLNHFVFFGERHLRYVVKEFVDHYLTERFHQGIGGQLVRVQAGPANDNRTGGQIVCRSRLGSLLNYFTAGPREPGQCLFGHYGLLREDDLGTRDRQARLELRVCRRPCFGDQSWSPDSGLCDSRRARRPSCASTRASATGAASSRAPAAGARKCRRSRNSAGSRSHRAQSVTVATATLSAPFGPEVAALLVISAARFRAIASSLSLGSST